MLRKRRLAIGVLGLVIQFSFGCSASSSVLGPDEIAGVYQLISVMGKPLPAATVPGREELDSARLVLGAAGSLAATRHGTLCVLGTCSTFHDTASGTWALNGGNDLSFALSGQGGPAAPIKAEPGYIITHYSVDGTYKEFLRYKKQ